MNIDNTTESKAETLEAKILHSRFYKVASLLNLGLSAYFFWLGISTLDKPCNYNLQVWMIIGACALVVYTVLVWLPKFSTDHAKRCIDGVRRLLGLFSFVWAIVGSVFAFRSSGELCDYTLWYTSFIYVIYFWSLIAFSCCCMGIAIGAKSAAASLENV